MPSSVRWSLGVGLAVSAGALYLAFRNVPLEALWRYLDQVDYRYLGLSLLLVGVVLAARTWRWQILLGLTHRIGFRQAFHPLMIALMLNGILPGRIGELARPALLRQRHRIAFATGLGSVMTERILDLLSLLALFAWVLADVDLNQGKPASFGGYRLDGDAVLTAARATLGAALVILAAAGGLCSAKMRRLAVQFLGGMADAIPWLSPPQRRWIEARILLPFRAGLEHLAAGLALGRHPWRLLAAAGLSILIWLLTAISFQVLALGFPELELRLAQMTAVMAVICFCIALPSVPGWWGLWEAGGVFALSLFGIEPGPALAFTLVNHGVQILPPILIGWVSMLIGGVRPGTLARISRTV
mgnify:CR=1 FL=1